jgi:hypothetical protein
VTPSGKRAARIHTARLYAARYELASHQAVWAELEQRKVAAAVVSFTGHAGRGGQADVPDVVDAAGERLRLPWQWATEELTHALQAPIWGRFGTFNGLPETRGELVWAVGSRQLLVRGRRGDTTFEETIA